MLNFSEQAEREYLGEMVSKLRQALKIIEDKIIAHADTMVESKRFAWESRGVIDKAEIAAYKIAMVEQSALSELSIKERNHLRKLILSPYFGRVDFAETGNVAARPFYIGIHSFFADNDDEAIIDWRAPLSSIFYDFELGKASYQSPDGEICGDIEVKRQYRIRGSEMEYMLESSLNIGDDVLQHELSRSSDEKMKNIVATIQKEQNSIIRNESAKVLIIQGAAGSGKTSIALHRMAFLLYRNKDKIKSQDILVLSPNKVFGSYISNVLPELGEENIPQMGFEELARQFLGRKRKFQTFAEQVTSLIEQNSDDAVKRIKYKASGEFVAKLKQFLQHCDDTCFAPTDIRVELFSVSGDELLSEYKRLYKMPIKKRIEKIANDRIAAYHRTHMLALSTAAKKEIKEQIQKMFRYADAWGMYKAFMDSLEVKDIFHTAAKGTLEFCDVFPLAWLTLMFEGTAHRYSKTEHLLVDEMQDYTPIQYAFLAELFACRMTILGDSHQSLNPYSSSSIETISPCFKNAECVELLKSYRSTIEILNFAQTIRSNKKIIPIERHGEEPSLYGCKTDDDEIARIKVRIAEFRKSDYHSLGIICKSQADAKSLYKKLSDDNISLLDFSSDSFSDGVIITSCYLSKGLEFDWVIVPDCSDIAYQTELDRSLLYIACTRAMHVLELTFCGKQSSIIAPATILARS